MTTQELKNKIEKVLGNSIRCLLPSYWWKNLFHSVADRIDEVETTVTKDVSDMVVKSLKEFEAKHPDIERSTLYYTTDENSALARSNVTKILRWEHAASFTTPNILKPLHIAVPFITTGDEVSAYIIQSPMYALDIFTESILFADVPFEGKSNIYINVYTGVATLKPASSSGGGSVMFVADPLGNLTEEQKQNNSDAFLKVLEAEGAIDINIMVMLFIAKPNMVSVNDNGDLVLIAAGIDGGASKFIFTPEGDVTIETVEPTSSGGVEIRELRISGSDEDNAYNLQTVELYKESKAIVVIPVAYHSSNPERTDRMQMPYYVDLYTNTEGVVAKFTFMVDDFRGGKYLINYTIKEDGSIEGSSSYTFDSAMSDESVNAVQNKVIKKYIDDAIANVGGGSDIVVDTEMSSTSTNPVQNKVVYSELQKKQGTINDLADIRSGAALGKTALQSVPSEYVTESELTEKGYATTSQVNDKQDRIDDLEAIRSGAAKGATALQSEQYKGTVTGVKINGTTKNPSSGVVDLGTVITAHQDISHLATKEELNSLTNEIITNEEVHAAALNDLNERKADKDEIAAKQDTIADLETIRDGAALGATALQSVPSEYVTETELADKGYLTEHQDISGKADKSDIPTKVSQLTNDSNFQTETEVFGTVLYNVDVANTNYGAVTLSDSTANYEFVDFYAATNDKHVFFNRVYQPNGKKIVFSGAFVGNTSLFLKAKVYECNGNKLTTAKGTNDLVWAGEWGSEKNSLARGENTVGIWRVVGYKR